MFENRFKSLKTILSFMVVGIITAMVTILVTVSYNTAYNSVKNAYVNQLLNFSTDIDGQIARFYDQEAGNADFLAKNKIIREAVDTGNFEYAAEMIKSFADQHKVYENILISTAESNPRILSGLAGVGSRWGGTGYDDCIRKALNGESWVSDPQKSPVTGLPVNFFAAPIKKGNTVIGIMGLAVNMGEFSGKVIKDIKVANSGYPYLLSRDGMCIAHPNKDLIFKLNVNDYDWGKKLLSSANKEVISYNFQGEDKLIVPIKNEKYRFITGVTVDLKDINDEARSLALIMVIIGIVAVVIAGVVIYLMIVSRLSPLEGCRNVIKEMAAGNLSLRYNEKCNNDEIGEMVQSINAAMDQFERTISEIIIASQNLSQAVQEIASGNENLSQRTSEQASSLEEVASTIEEATASIKQNADNSVNAKKMATDSFQMAEEGGKIVGEAVTAINEVNVFSRKIGDIISVINEIAFQTNLLALNAAVEAARAGEQGRGFAVVAGEVRNLAQRAGSSAKDISQLIQESLEKVSVSTEFANKSGEALNKIISSVKSVDQLISEISAASEEQKRGIDQINIAVAELDTMTQQNAALVEETASASEEMSNQSQELIAMTEKFKIRDEVQSDLSRKKHKELHLHTTTSAKSIKKKDDGNGKKQGASAADKAKSGTIKEMLAQEGFEEF